MKKKTRLTTGRKKSANNKPTRQAGQSSKAKQPSPDRQAKQSEAKQPSPDRQAKQSEAKQPGDSQGHRRLYGLYLLQKKRKRKRKILYRSTEIIIGISTFGLMITLPSLPYTEASR